MPMAMEILQRLPQPHEQMDVVNKFSRVVVLTVMSTTPIGVNLILVGMWKSLVPRAKPIFSSKLRVSRLLATEEGEVVSLLAVAE